VVLRLRIELFGDLVEAGEHGVDDGLGVKRLSQLHSELIGDFSECGGDAEDILASQVTCSRVSAFLSRSWGSACGRHQT
jgi:hypothetical protein